MKETGPFQRALDIFSLTGIEPAMAFLKGKCYTNLATDYSEVTHLAQSETRTHKSFDYKTNALPIVLLGLEGGVGGVEPIYNHYLFEDDEVGTHLANFPQIFFRGRPPRVLPP